MRRYSGQKALYEAMSRSSSKPKRPSMLARLRPQLAKLRPQLEKLRRIATSRSKRLTPGTEPGVEKPAAVTLRPARPVEVSQAKSQGPAQTWLRPKAVQYNDGRIEVSIPYQIGIIIGLGLILILMMGFWFGRRVGRIDERSRYNKQVVTPQADVGAAPERLVTPDADAPAPEASPEAATGAADAATLVRTGDNVIVLARHAVRTQLEPVQAYFREHDIETRIVSYAKLRRVFEQYHLDVSRLPQGDGYMLVTLDLYENPAREGTNGYLAKQKIVELGRGYKAEPGFESFASKHFSDAYGMKIAK